MEEIMDNFGKHPKNKRDIKPTVENFQMLFLVMGHLPKGRDFQRQKFCRTNIFHSKMPFAKVRLSLKAEKESGSKVTKNCQLEDAYRVKNCNCL